MNWGDDQQEDQACKPTPNENLQNYIDLLVRPPKKQAKISDIPFYPEQYRASVAKEHNLPVERFAYLDDPDDIDDYAQILISRRQQPLKQRVRNRLLRRLRHIFS